MLKNIPSYNDFRIDEVVNYDETYGRGNGVTDQPMVNEVDAWIMAELAPNPITFKRTCWREDVSYSTPFGLKLNVSMEKGQLWIRWFQDSGPHSAGSASLQKGNFFASDPKEAISKLSSHPFLKGFKKSLVAAKVTRPMVLSKLRAKLSPKALVEYMNAIGPIDLKDRSGPSYKSFGARTGSDSYHYGYDLTLAIERGWEIDAEWVEANKKEIVGLLGLEGSSQYHTSTLTGFGYDESKHILWYQTHRISYYD